MTSEDTIVCLCTRQHFETTHIQKLIAICQGQTIEWDEVFDTADRHGVAPLVYTNLMNHQNGSFAVPQAVMNKFKKAYIHNVFVKKGTGPILEEALALFARKGLDVMLVKGAALNVLVYEKPWYTRSYDIDLVIKARRDEIDETDHFELVETLEKFNHQRNEFKEHIEYDYYEHHDVTMNNVLMINSERLWQEAHKIQVNGYDVFVMTPEDMLLAAAINSCRKRFFRLKSLCDIAEIIHHYPDLNWDLLADKAIEYECNTILYTALIVTQTTLGCPLPENVLSALKVNPMRAVIINHLVKNLCRNFTLTELFERSESTVLGREFSWPLVLTYTAYRANHIVPKMTEIYRAWRNPPPPVPG